jgi:hypothetical protein
LSGLFVRISLEYLLTSNLKDPVIFLQFAALSRCQRTRGDLLSPYLGNGLTEAGVSSTCFGLPCQAFLFTFFGFPHSPPFGGRFAHGLATRYSFYLTQSALSRTFFALFSRLSSRLPFGRALREWTREAACLSTRCSPPCQELISLFFLGFPRLFRGLLRGLSCEAGSLSTRCGPPCQELIFALFSGFPRAIRESAKDGLSFFRRFVATTFVTTRVGV